MHPLILSITQPSMKETSPRHLVSEWIYWSSSNLFPAIVFVGVSRGKHYHLSCFHCFSSIMALAVRNSCSSSLCLWTEWLKVQGFVFKGSFNTAEHPAILHPRTRWVRAQPGEQRGAVVFQWTPSLRHHGHIWEEAKSKEEVEQDWLKTSGNKMKPERRGGGEGKEAGGGGDEDCDLKLTGADEGEEEETPDRNLQFISLLMVFIIINKQEVIFPHKPSSVEPPSISFQMSKCAQRSWNCAVDIYVCKRCYGMYHKCLQMISRVSPLLRCLLLHLLLA